MEVREETATTTVSNTVESSGFIQQHFHVENRFEAYVETEHAPTTSDQTFQAAQLMAEFKEIRILSQKKQFAGVVATGWLMLLFGCTGFLVDFFLYSMVAEYRAVEMWSRSFSAFCLFFTNLGIILFSTVPVEMLDIDKVVAWSAPKFWVRWLIAAVGGLISVVTAVVPPYTATFNVFICLTLVYPDDESSYFFNRFSFKMAFWYLFYIFGLSVNLGYFAYLCAWGVSISS
jgi:hypothetical protein